MTCEQIVDLLVEYVEGELLPDASAQVESHVTECPDCEHFVNTYKATISLAETAFTQAMPAEVKTAMEEQLRKAIGGEG
jgi:anti-sigma factor RsiW